MSLSPFNWKGQPSQIGEALGRTQTAPKTTPKSITFKRDASNVSINTELQDKLQRVRGAAT